MPASGAARGGPGSEPTTLLWTATVCAGDGLMRGWLLWFCPMDGSENRRAVRAVVAEHPYTSLKVLTRLAADKDPRVRSEVVSRPDVPTGILAMLTDDDWGVSGVAQERLSSF